MDSDQVLEHSVKASLKRIIDCSPNFNEKMKHELKGIVDLGRSTEEIAVNIVTYIATVRCRY